MVEFIFITNKILNTLRVITRGFWTKTNQNNSWIPYRSGCDDVVVEANVEVGVEVGVDGRGRCRW